MPDKLNDLIESARTVDRLEPAHADALFERLTAGLGVPSAATDTGMSTASAPSAADPSVIVGAGSPGALGTWLVGGLVAGAIGFATMGAPTGGVLPGETSGGERLVTATRMNSSSAAPERKDETKFPEVRSSSEEAQRANRPDESPRNAERSAPPTAAVKQPSPPKDALAEEVALVRAAKLELNAKQYQRALTRLDEYDRKFPAGALRSESQATRILALCGLERPDAARETAAHLDENSALGKRLGAGCPTR